MQELEVTWGRALSVTWLIFWRGMVGSIIIGSLVGFAIGFGFSLSKALLKINAEMNPLITGGPAAIAGLVWYLVVVRMALQKQYRQFRIALVSRPLY